MYLIENAVVEYDRRGWFSVHKSTMCLARHTRLGQSSDYGGALRDDCKKAGGEGPILSLQAPGSRRLG